MRRCKECGLMIDTFCPTCDVSFETAFEMSEREIAEFEADTYPQSWLANGWNNRRLLTEGIKN